MIHCHDYFRVCRKMIYSMADQFHDTWIMKYTHECMLFDLFMAIFQFLVIQTDTFTNILRVCFTGTATTFPVAAK